MPRNQPSQTRPEHQFEYHLDNDVIKEFGGALDTYKALFNTDQPMPKDRAREVSQIRELLDKPGITHEEFHGSVSQIVEKMWTGWVISGFQIIPWSSRLKNELEILLCHTYDLSTMQNRDTLQTNIQNREFAQLREAARNHNNNNAGESPQMVNPQNTELQKQMAKLQVDVERQNGRISSLETQLAANSQIIENQKKQIEEGAQKLTDANSTIEGLQKDKQLLKTRKKILKTENEKLKDEIEKLKAKLGSSAEPDPGSSDGAQQDNPKGSAPSQDDSYDKSSSQPYC